MLAIHCTLSPPIKCYKITIFAESYLQFFHIAHIDGLQGECFHRPWHESVSLGQLEEEPAGVFTARPDHLHPHITAGAIIFVLPRRYLNGVRNGCNTTGSEVM